MIELRKGYLSKQATDNYNKIESGKLFITPTNLERKWGNPPLSQPGESTMNFMEYQKIAFRK